MIINYYAPQEDSYNSHDTLANNLIFNSDYECVKCGKTNPITEPNCHGCDYRDNEIYEFISKVQMIDNKMSIIIKRVRNPSSYKSGVDILKPQLNQKIREIIATYPRLTPRVLTYLKEDHLDILIELDFLLLNL